MLTARQTDVLHAVLDRIIPPDDFPGAWEAGVGDYLFAQFRRDLADWLPLYRNGLEALDAEARATAGVGFVEMSAGAQDALLWRVEAGRISTHWSVEPQRLLRALVLHAMEGFYSDPGNGGNRDGVAWKMIGFEVRG
jgi:hypothetical protein